MDDEETQEKKPPCHPLSRLDSLIGVSSRCYQSRRGGLEEPSLVDVEEVDVEEVDVEEVDVEEVDVEEVDVEEVDVEEVDVEDGCQAGVTNSRSKRTGWLIASKTTICCKLFRSAAGA
ncbi:hypothetical protein FOPE_10004 [Fonsecaea pedrosoi]|nr:hypothetical protein FOPE_10004 [Fonsecaea pedrosoi]